MKTTKLFLILPLIGMLSCGKAKQKTKEQNLKLRLFLLPSKEVIRFCHWHKRGGRVNEKMLILVLPLGGGGSGVGLTALIDGTTDIAMASREVKTEEKLKFSEMKKRFRRSNHCL